MSDAVSTDGGSTDGGSTDGGSTDGGTTAGGSADETAPRNRRAGDRQPGPGPVPVGAVRAEVIPTGDGSGRIRWQRIETFASGLVLTAAVVGLAVAVHNVGSSNAVRTPDTRAISAVEKGPTTTVVLAPFWTTTDAAEQLYYAWQRRDPAGAARFANTDAIAEMFALDATAAAGLAFVGCTKPTAAVVTCSWTRRGARLTMRVSDPVLGPARVQSVEMR